MKIKAPPPNKGTKPEINTKKKPQIWVQFSVRSSAMGWGHQTHRRIPLLKRKIKLIKNKLKKTKLTDPN